MFFSVAKLHTKGVVLLEIRQNKRRENRPEEEEEAKW